MHQQDLYSYSRSTWQQRFELTRKRAVRTSWRALACYFCAYYAWCCAGHVQPHPNEGNSLVPRRLRIRRAGNEMNRSSTCIVGPSHFPLLLAVATLRPVRCCWCECGKGEGEGGENGSSASWERRGAFSIGRKEARVSPSVVVSTVQCVTCKSRLVRSLPHLSSICANII